MCQSWSTESMESAVMCTLHLSDQGTFTPLVPGKVGSYGPQ